MSVFVSGANGFLAQHIIGDLLDQNYKVIGSVRSQTKADDLLRNYNNGNLTLVIIPDISSPGAFNETFKKYGNIIRYVIHVATGVTSGTSNDFDKNIIEPIISTAMGILESIKIYAGNSVKRFIYTSSVVAMRSSKNKIFDETSWNQIEHKDVNKVFLAYFYAKKMAEQAIWIFKELNKDSVKFTVTSVNPSLILGPERFDSSDLASNRSNESIIMIINSNADANPDITGFSESFINVHDVSRAHILAIQRDSLIGARLIVANNQFSDQDVLDILNKETPYLKGKIPVGNPGTGHMATTGGLCYINDDTSRRLLDFQYISLRDTVCGVVEQFLNQKEHKSSLY